MEWKTQAHIFVVTLATGFVAGVIFDIYHLRILGVVLSGNKVFIKNMIFLQVFYAICSINVLILYKYNAQLVDKTVDIFWSFIKI